MTPRPKPRKRKGGLLRRLSGSFTDPRRAGGSIDPATSTIEPRLGVLLENVGVAEVGLERDVVGEGVMGIEVRGKINTLDEEARILLLATPAAAALLAAQIIGLGRAGRIAPEFAAAFDNYMREAAGQ